MDGALSNSAYLRSVDVCYNNFLDRTVPQGDIDTFDYLIFHSPYNKLVQKSIGRLLYNDFVRNPETCGDALSSALADWHPAKVDPTTTYTVPCHSPYSIYPGGDILLIVLL